MTSHELYELLKAEYKKKLAIYGMKDQKAVIFTKALTPEEAIGITERKDYPILTGKEVMIQAFVPGGKGQAFTDAPSDWEGTLQEIGELDIERNSHDRAMFIAVLNALQNALGESDHSIHCKNSGPELCAKQAVQWVREHYGHPKITLVGYQPALIGALSKVFSLRVLDLNPANVGQIREGVRIEHGIDDQDSAAEWADLILCTGSTLCNDSILYYINLDKEVVYFGTTLSGAAPILGLRRMCFTEEK